MEAIIQVKDLSFAYPDGHQALRDVSLTVAPGEKVALVGPNGAGKSTLMLHLNGILHPASGAVRVVGLDVQGSNLPRVRGAVGLVFQDPDDQLFSPGCSTTWRSGRSIRGCGPLRCVSAWPRPWRRSTWGTWPSASRII